MHSPTVVFYRCQLRRILTDSTPGMSSQEAYMQLRGLSPDLTFAHLAEFCDAAKVPRDYLPLIFAPYGVKHEYLTLKAWIDFVNDQFVVGRGFPPASLEQKKSVLDKFLIAVRKHARDSRVGTLWSWFTLRNTTGVGRESLRVSAFLRINKEFGWGFDDAQLVDEVFGFYGKGVEVLKFEEFAQLVESFAEV